MTLSLTPGKPFSWKDWFIWEFSPHLWVPFCYKARSASHVQLCSRHRTKGMGSPWLRATMICMEDQGRGQTSSQQDPGVYEGCLVFTSLSTVLSQAGMLWIRPLWEQRNSSVLRSLPGTILWIWGCVSGMKLAAKLKLLPKSKHRLISVSGWLEHRLWL